MINLKGKSQEELLEMSRGFEVDSTEYKAVTFEVQRIQQDINNIQIANLIEITRKNAEISRKNARSSNILSIVAIIIAIMVGILQILIQTNIIIP